jgi:hypothetical protein
MFLPLKRILGAMRKTEMQELTRIFIPHHNHKIVVMAKTGGTRDHLCGRTMGRCQMVNHARVGSGSEAHVQSGRGLVGVRITGGPRNIWKAYRVGPGSRALKGVKSHVC